MYDESRDKFNPEIDPSIIKNIKKSFPAGINPEGPVRNLSGFGVSPAAFYHGEPSKIPM